MRRLLATGLAGAVAAAALTLVAPSQVAAAPAQAASGGVPQLHREGRWLVDEKGRVVLIHGLNLVWKLDPYVPPDTAAGFTARDARWIRRHGFNGARIGTLWSGITPDAPGVADPSYFAKWQRVMDLLADQQVWMQLDVHQDMWHETYGGEGVPDWAAVRPLPYALLPAVKLPFPLGYFTPEVGTVYDNFFANVGGVRDGWVAAWKLAAKEWKDQPYSMGYDLMNEPSAGTEVATCFLDGCPSTYVSELQPTMEAARAAIRTVDPKSLIWFEPQQLAAGSETDTYYEAVPGEQNLGFSWHSYCQQVFLESQGLPVSDVEQCTEFSEGRMEHALDQGARMNATSLMSEFGATDNVRALEIDTASADRFGMGWMYWAYKKWNDPTTADDSQGLFRDDADLSSVKAEKLRMLVRTYPQATAGTPKSLSFDAKTGAFRYTYTPRSLGAPTVIFVSPLHYQGTPQVSVSGGRLLNTPSERRLRIQATGTGPVTVTIKSK